MYIEEDPFLPQLPRFVRVIVPNKAGGCQDIGVASFPRSNLLMK